MIDFAIGIVTAVGSAAAFGSFGVPIKCKQILDAKVTWWFSYIKSTHLSHCIWVLKDYCDNSGGPFSIPVL